MLAKLRKKELLKLDLNLSSVEKKEQKIKPDCSDPVQTGYGCQEVDVWTSHGSREVAVHTHGQATAMETNGSYELQLKS